MSQRYRYSMWDGTQEVPEFTADDILDNLTDDLMNFGDLEHALRNMLQRGMRNPMGDRTQGLRDLLQKLRQQRRDQLDKFNLSSVFDDLKQLLFGRLRAERVDEIVDTESRQHLERSLVDCGEGRRGDQYARGRHLLTTCRFHELGDIEVPGHAGTLVVSPSDG